MLGMIIFWVSLPAGGEAEVVLYVCGGSSTVDGCVAAGEAAFFENDGVEGGEELWFEEVCVAVVPEVADPSEEAGEEGELC